MTTEQKLIEKLKAEIKQNCPVCGNISKSPFRECGCHQEGINEGLQKAIDLLSALEKELAEQKSEPALSAEKLIDNYIQCPEYLNYFGHNPLGNTTKYIAYGDVVQLMQEYRQAGIREKLLGFAQQFYADEETCIHNVNIYLNQSN